MLTCAALTLALTTGFMASAPASACTAGDGARLLHADRGAAALATRLFTRHGHCLATQEAFEMDGGFRGRIRIVPALPVGRHRKHLAWVSQAADGHDTVLAQLSSRAPAPFSFRWKSLTFRFFISQRRTTPSAYADRDGIAYNLVGSLNHSAAAVDELLFHELFHLNDGWHGGWSQVALTQVHRTVTQRCGTSRACLKPYAPGTTTVRGGTYYAFQPDNGSVVGEYAAELAIRYLAEQRAALAGQPPGAPFKCATAENADAWNALVTEFFGGVDLVGPCR